MTPDEQYIYDEALGLMGVGPNQNPTPQQHREAMERVERWEREFKQQKEQEKTNYEQTN